MPPDRSLVPHRRAAPLLLIVVVCFGASVVLTRLFLDLTGYPKLGGDSEIHVAHVLWGGLLLTLGALLPLLFANSWTLTLAAVLDGIGVGLFIDEVGKFITQKTDYFYPLAAPIIYATFLLLVLAFLLLRRRGEPSPRAQLYDVFDSMKDVLDHDLDRRERGDLLRSLRALNANATAPSHTALATALLAFLESDELELAPRRVGRGQRAASRLQFRLRRMATRRRLKAIVTLGFVGLIFTALLGVLVMVSLMFDVGILVKLAQPIISGNATYFDDSPTWVIISIAVNTLCGLLGVAGVVAILRGRVATGLRLGMVGLVIGLTLGNLLTFYFQQFYAVFDALWHLLVLLCARTYLRRYVPEDERQAESRGAAGQSAGSS